jgi:hypothetical protein
MFKPIHRAFGAATRADLHVHQDDRDEFDPIPRFNKPLDPDLAAPIDRIPEFLQCIIKDDFTVDTLRCLLLCLHHSADLSTLIEATPDLNDSGLYLRFSVFLDGLFRQPDFVPAQILLGIIDGIWRAGSALFPEPLIDSVIPYFTHADLSLASLAFSCVANLAAASPECPALLLTKDIAPVILAYFNHFPTPHREGNHAVRLIAILSKTANRDSWAPFFPLLPFVLPYVNVRFPVWNHTWSPTVIARSIALVEGDKWIFDWNVVDTLVAANQLFHLLPLYEAYDGLIARGLNSLLNRDDWYDVLYRLIGDMADHATADIFGCACGVIRRMAESHGTQIYEHGIARAMIAMTQHGRSELRRAAAICLGHLICVLPMALSAELAENGALAALCDVVGQERFPGTEAALHAILRLVRENNHWCLVARDAGLCITTCEGDQEDEMLSDLMAEVVAVVFPGLSDCI